MMFMRAYAHSDGLKEESPGAVSHTPQNLVPDLPGPTHLSTLSPAQAPGIEMEGTQRGPE